MGHLLIKSMYRSIRIVLTPAILIESAPAPGLAALARAVRCRPRAPSDGMGKRVRAPEPLALRAGGASSARPRLTNAKEHRLSGEENGWLQLRQQKREYGPEMVNVELTKS